jgi:hypothetical protein
MPHNLTMTNGQYMRIETAAGGLGASPRAFVREAHKLLSPKGRTRAMRAERHSWIRSGLAVLIDNKEMLP